MDRMQIDRHRLGKKRLKKRK